jgi:hypothetical protein
MSIFVFNGTQSQVAEKLKSFRKTWGPPGKSWNFNGNYQKLEIITRDEKITVWLTLTNEFKKYG